MQPNELFQGSRRQPSAATAVLGKGADELSGRPSNTVKVIGLPCGSAGWGSEPPAARLLSPAALGPHRRAGRGASAHAGARGFHLLKDEAASLGRPQTDGKVSGGRECSPQPPRPPGELCLRLTPPQPCPCASRGAAEGRTRGGGGCGCRRAAGPAPAPSGRAPGLRQPGGEKGSPTGPPH